MSTELAKCQETPNTATKNECCRVQYTPRVDIREKGDEILLYADLPGVAPEDLDIRFEEGELSIHGKVATRHEGLRDKHREYGIGDFHRSFTIDESIDGQAISAELSNGVLTLRLPKTEKVKARRIEVQSG